MLSLIQPQFDNPEPSDSELRKPRDLNGAKVSQAAHTYAQSRLPVPKKIATEGSTPLNGVPHESVTVLLQKAPPLPTVDKASTIQIEPGPEELQAVEQLFQHLPTSCGHKEQELLVRAYRLASYAHRTQKRESGEAYIFHPLTVTRILADLNMDADTLAAG